MTTEVRPMYANALFRKDGPASEIHSQLRKQSSWASEAAVVITTVVLTTLTSFSNTLDGAQISQSVHARNTISHADCPHTSDWIPASIRDPLSLTELLCPKVCRASANDLFFCHRCNHPALPSGPALFSGLGMLGPAFEQHAAHRKDELHSRPSIPAELDFAEPTYDAVLESPVPRVPAPWVFKGNDAQGVRTWLSKAHVIEINPRWLDFSMFDSMNLSMTDDPPGPGQSGSQEWRSAFTVGMATDWQFTRHLAMHAGYRFYNNPIPNDITSGAFPNANQHIVACGVSLTEGRHSLSLVYGLDVMDPSGDSGISSARHGNDIDSLVHLATLNYGFSF